MNILTRQEAILAGKTRYFSGLACPRGHIAERLVSTRACAECVREKKHLWIKNNPDKVNSQKRSWRNRNIEKARALNIANQKLHRDSANRRNRKYAEANREKLRSKNAVWEAANPDKVAARVARRRASKLKQTPVWADHQTIAKIYWFAQQHRKHGLDVHVDHVIPLQGRSVCGLHVHNNLQIIQANANRSKSNLLKE